MKVIYVIARWCVAFVFAVAAHLIFKHYKLDPFLDGWFSAFVFGIVQELFTKSTSE